MDLRISDRIVIEQGRFSAIAAPVEVMLAGMNDNPVLDRYTSILVSGNFSRLLNGINRTSGNFEIQRAFTVHQLLTILRENDHSIMIVEHDPTLYDDAGDTKRLIPPAMKDIARNCIFILYAPAMDRSFAYLASAADHLICYDSNDEISDAGTWNYPGPGKRKNGLPQEQRTLANYDGEKIPDPDLRERGEAPEEPLPDFFSGSCNPAGRAFARPKRPEKAGFRERNGT